MLLNHLEELMLRLLQTHGMFNGMNVSRSRSPGDKRNLTETVTFTEKTKNLLIIPFVSQ